jgi:hypothetical protein
MQIATWNLSHAVKHGQEQRNRAWQYLASLGADIAIVQEAGLPISGTKSNLVGHNPEERDWVAAVVSYGPELRELDQPLRPSWDQKLEFRIPDAARPGTLGVAVIDFPGERPILAVSLYGRLRYADQSVLRAASDLLPIFDTKMGTRVVLAGDLNIHTHSDNPAERRRAGPILALLESFGLRDLVRYAKNNGRLIQGPQEHLEVCPCGLADCSHVRTHRHKNHSPGRMANNDYFFATQELATKLELLTIRNGDDDASWLHSDHAPMIARFKS